MQIYYLPCTLFFRIDGQILKQTLLYLYGGVVEVDPSCALGGLVMMADMYGMEGLKEVVAYNLNVQYCHFFHRVTEFMIFTQYLP